MFKLDKNIMNEIINENLKMQGEEGYLDEGIRTIYNGYMYIFDYYKIIITEYSDGKIGDVLEYIEINYINHRETYCDIVDMLVNSNKYKGMSDLFHLDAFELITYHDEDFLTENEYKEEISRIGLKYYKRYDKLSSAEDINLFKITREHNYITELFK